MHVLDIAGDLVNHLFAFNLHYRQWFGYVSIPQRNAVNILYCCYAWVTEPNPVKAAQLFTYSTLQSNKDKDHLTFTLSLVERNRAIILFYKRPRVEWADALQCRLIGKKKSKFSK